MAGAAARRWPGRLRRGAFAGLDETLPPLFPDEVGSADGLPALPVCLAVALVWLLAILGAVGSLADETLAR
jgi:hypothetical protein